MPTGFKRGNLVFYYLKLQGTVYTSDFTGELLKTNPSDYVASKNDLEAKLETEGFREIAKVESINEEDIPMNDLEANGFAIGDKVFENLESFEGLVFVFTETPFSIFNDLPQEDKQYQLIPMHPWSENELGNRAK